MNEAAIAPETDQELALERVTASPFAQMLQRHELLIVVALAFYAAIRILFFSAAFPLFNSTDEQVHFDAVYKYSHGYLPERGLPLVSPECARIFTLYESPEYVTEAAVLRAAHMDRPIATLPPDMQAVKFQRYYSYWLSKNNFEIDSVLLDSCCLAQGRDCPSTH